jgi:hypothetical protein
VVNTSFLKPGSPVTFAPDKSLIVDRFMQAAPGLYAAGDIAKYEDAKTLPFSDVVRVSYFLLFVFIRTLGGFFLLTVSIPTPAVGRRACPHRALGLCTDAGTMRRPQHDRGGFGMGEWRELEWNWGVVVL